MGSVTPVTNLELTFTQSGAENPNLASTLDYQTQS